MLTYGSPLVIDLGYGAQAWTALEMYNRWLSLNPNLRLLGVEIDPDRVANALPYQQSGVIEFRLGGFNLADITGLGKARSIRAYNVLRQYDETAVSTAFGQMATALEMGGILLEGTSTPSGRIVAFDIYRKAEDGSLFHQELVFGTNLKNMVEPTHFQAILPKRLIHHMLDETPRIFFESWRQTMILARGAGQTSLRQQWIYAANLLHDRFGYPVDTRRRILRCGYLTLRSSLQP